MSTEISAWLEEAQAMDMATEGPWSARESVDGFSSSVHSPRGCVAVMRSTPSRELRTEELGPLRPGRRHEDAAFIADARTRLPQAIAALRAVLDLHRPLNELGSPPCATCLADDDGEAVFELWPCPTARTIAAALGVQP